MKSKALYAAKVREEYMIVGHFSQYAIIRDAIGNIFCIEDENECLEAGSVCEGNDMLPIDVLPELKKRAILMKYGEREIV